MVVNKLVVQNFYFLFVKIASEKEMKAVLELFAITALVCHIAGKWL